MGKERQCVYRKKKKKKTRKEKKKHAMSFGSHMRFKAITRIKQNIRELLGGIQNQQKEPKKIKNKTKEKEKESQRKSHFRKRNNKTYNPQRNIKSISHKQTRL